MTAVLPSRLFRASLLVCSLLPFAAEARAQQPGDLRCPYTRRMSCTPEGCEPSQIEGSYLMVPPLQTLRDAGTLGTTIRIHRCDGGGCIPVEVTHASAEGFLTLMSGNGAYLFKIYGDKDLPQIELRTGAFTEVVTSMLMSFVSYGQCVVPETGPTEPETEARTNPLA
jgi:hypothetical protein